MCIEPTMVRTEAPMGSSTITNIKNRPQLKWEQCDYLNPNLHLPNTINHAALAQTDKPIRILPTKYLNQNSKSTSGKGKTYYWSQTNGFSTFLTEKSDPQSQFHTPTVQQVNSLKNADSSFQNMASNVITLGEVGDHFRHIKGPERATLETRAGIAGLQMIGLSLEKTENTDSTINRIDDAMNPQAVSNQFLKHGVTTLGPQAMMLSVFSVFLSSGHLFCYDCVCGVSLLSSSCFCLIVLCVFCRPDNKENILLKHLLQMHYEMLDEQRRQGTMLKMLWASNLHSLKYLAPDVKVGVLANELAQSMSIFAPKTKAKERFGFLKKLEEMTENMILNRQKWTKMMFSNDWESTENNICTLHEKMLSDSFDCDC